MVRPSLPLAARSSATTSTRPSMPRTPTTTSTRARRSCSSSTTHSSSPSASSSMSSTVSARAPTLWAPCLVPPPNLDRSRPISSDLVRSRQILIDLTRSHPIACHSLRSTRHLGERHLPEGAQVWHRRRQPALLCLQLAMPTRYAIPNRPGPPLRLLLWRSSGWYFACDGRAKVPSRDRCDDGPIGARREAEAEIGMRAAQLWPSGFGCKGGG